MIRRGLACVVLAALAAGCGGGHSSPPAPTPTATVAKVALQQAAVKTVRPNSVAKLMVPAAALSSPGGAVVDQLGTSVRPGGGPTRLLVLGRRTQGGKTWLKVLLPVRPNGTSGWIPRTDTIVSTTPWAVVVSLADRRAYVIRAGKLQRSFAVVIGAPKTPTPTGRFAISEAIKLPDPTQFYGSWMLTLTAHSNVLDTFEGGDGQVALHGRGGNSLTVPVGTAGSNGCVRMRNGDIAWLAGRAGAGTPVVVMARSLRS